MRKRRKDEIIREEIDLNCMWRGVPTFQFHV